MHENQQQQQQQQTPNLQSNQNPFHSAANNALWSLQDRPNSSASNAMSGPTNIPQNLFNNTPAVQPTSIINLSNSSDVVIGPMTQYQGPVTIYQYMDATVDSRTTQARGGIDQSRKNHKTTIAQKFTNTKLLIVLIILVIIMAGIILTVELTLLNKNQRTIRTSDAIYFDNDQTDGTFINIGNRHLIIERVQWGSSEVAKKLVRPLEHPIPYVLITHVGVQSQPCSNIYKCSIKMRTIQDSAIAGKNLPDIQSNFYVANDGNIYVGRGWDWANTYANNSLAITFLGDYQRYVPPVKQLDAIQHLISYALTKKYLSLDYKLVAQNQTKITRSPGVNVYKIIKNWPHFNTCGLDGNPRCGSELGMPDIWDAKQ